MPKQLNDYARMVPEEMDPEQEGPLDEESIAFAMVSRENGGSGQYRPPKKSYDDVNPYQDGGHGSWVEENMDMLDGMAGGKFELEVIDDEDVAIERRDELIEDDEALSARSSEYQRAAVGGGEEY